MLDICKAYFPSLDWVPKHSDPLEGTNVGRGNTQEQACLTLCYFASYRGMEIEVIKLPSGAMATIGTWRSTLWRSPNNQGLGVDEVLGGARDFMDDLINAFGKEE